jgi:hypothetical protein
VSLLINTCWRDHLRVYLATSRRFLLNIRILLSVVCCRSLLGHGTREYTRFFCRRLLRWLIIIAWLKRGLVIFIRDRSRCFCSLFILCLRGRKKRAFFLLRLSSVLLFALGILNGALFLKLELNCNIIRGLSRWFLFRWNTRLIKILFIFGTSCLLVK